MTRWKAAGIHLLISGVVAAATTLALALVWYPGRLFSLTGGLELVLLIVGVDAGLGPLCTAVVFNPLKSRAKLVFNLVVIGTLQLSALFYGVFAAAVNRPAYIVFGDGLFALVRAIDLDDNVLAAAQPEFRSLPWTGPRWIGAVTLDGLQFQETTAMVFGKATIHDLPRSYRSLDEVRDQIRATSSTIADMEKRNPETSGRALQMAKSEGLSVERAGFIPLRAPNGTFGVMVDRELGEPVAVVPFNPNF